MTGFQRESSGASADTPDPTLIALEVLLQAMEAHGAASRTLEEAIRLSRDGSNKAMAAWHLYRVPDLEMDEARTASALLLAQRVFLDTAPTSLLGSIAVLNVLQDYLLAEPDVGLAARSLAHVEALLSTIVAASRSAPAC